MSLVHVKVFLLVFGEARLLKETLTSITVNSKQNKTDEKKNLEGKNLEGNYAVITTTKCDSFIRNLIMKSDFSFKLLFVAAGY